MTDTIEAFRANTDLITRPELTAIFGETMPVEVFQALTAEGATLAETRNAVADIAAAQNQTDTTAGEGFQRKFDREMLTVIAAHLRSNPPHLYSGRQCEEMVMWARDAALAAQPSAGAQSIEISDADLLRAVMDAAEEITLTKEDDFWRQQTLDSIAKARATPDAPETLEGIKPARLLLKHIALYATPAQPDTGDVAASQRVIALIADAANAVGWQAGEPGMEIAGGLLSYLAAHPDKVEAFLSNPSDVMMSHNAHDGCLTWRTTKGEIINREIYQERIAARDAALSKPNAPGAPEDGGV